LVSQDILRQRESGLGLGTLPNSLSAARIAASAILAVSVLGSWSPFAACAICIAAAGSDFLDGYLARQRCQASHFGAILDPVADKIFVVTALVLLSHTRRIEGMAFWAVLVIIWRELAVAGFRTGRRASGVMEAVSGLAKLKTAIQYLAVILLFAAQLPSLAVARIGEIGQGTLWVAAGLSAITGASYLVDWRRTWK
jgi:CDP-diacylglycerol--glycerol-3-phosphate 3-phosphatidyltransferase